MNRIVIIGNGFDIAHGLKTGYRDFIKYLQDGFIDLVNNDETGIKALNHFIFGFGTATSESLKGGSCERVYHNKTIESWEDLSEHTSIQYVFLDDGGAYRKSFRARPHSKNKFLEYVLEGAQNKTWGGFENDYKDCLIKLVNHNQDEKNNRNSGNDSIRQLNADFKQIIELLHEYLRTIKVPTILHKEIFWRLFTQPLRRWGMNGNDNSKFGRLSYLTDDQEIDNLEHILFLNFNYTATVKNYLFSPDNRETIEHLTSLQTKKYQTQTSLRYIHGDLADDDPSSLIFGYGDELDEHQAILETMNDEFLKHIKSVLYTRNGYYREVVDFADAEEFDIVIFGHSCSNTDRTLLNTLFEHQNCVSIQPYLYDRNDTSIYINIYRCFKDKKLMRSRVVDQTNTTSRWENRQLASMPLRQDYI